MSAIPAGYKQTEVGVIPEDWIAIDLPDFCLLQRGFDITEKTRANGVVPVYSSSGLSYFHNRAMVFPPGVVTGRKGILGKVFLINEPFWPHDTTLWVKDFKGNLPAFVALVLQNFHLERLDAATSVPTLNRNNLAGQLVAIPPTKSEQESIAEALSDVDDLIGSLEQLLTKKRHLKQATMQELLTGKRRLPGFSGEWEMKRLGDVATFFKGKGLPKSALVPDGAESCIHYGELFTRYPEVVGEIISRTSSSGDLFRSIANDVLMPTSDVTPRGLAKASCVTVNGVILGGDILVIRSDVKRINGPFLSYVIRREEGQVLQLVTGSTVFHLYGSDMKKFTFLMPSVLEQIAIVTILSDMDAELADLETQLAKTRAIKQGMMQKLLTGEIRLVSPMQRDV